MKSVKANIAREERLPTTLPIQLDQGLGIARDISASGVFFETEVNYQPGSEIRFSVEFDGPWGKMMMKCQGQVVRVEQLNEQQDGKVGMAAKITELRLKQV